MENQDTVIRVEGLGKRYRLGSQQKRADGALARILQTATSPFNWIKTQMTPPTEEEILWALRDISFEVKRGEVLGIIGSNGAGKSTLLKILSRITEPTNGYAEIRGRVASLLEVGTGMHPELTGRENIYQNGCILGMRKWEIDKQFDEIVDFSGIERFIDTPVKRYSSGQRVRLGFSIAAHLEPEVLIVDEVLAVGDIEFQNKCLGKMKDVSGSGRTVLFVSHNMSAVETLCSRGIVLRHGQQVADVSAKEAVSIYLANNNQSNESLDSRTDRDGSGEIRFQSIKVFDSFGNETTEVMSGNECYIYLKYLVNDNTVDLSQVIFSISLRDSYDKKVVFFRTDEMGVKTESVDGNLWFHIPQMMLRGGSFTITVAAFTTDNRIYDLVQQTASITIIQGDWWKSGVINKAGMALVDGSVIQQPQFSS